MTCDIRSVVVPACVAAAVVTFADSPHSPPDEITRPTVKGEAFQSKPFFHRLVHTDSLYAFYLRHYGVGEQVPAFIAGRYADRTWIEVTHLSTEHARLGRSPDHNDIPLSVGWDFSRLANEPYVALPLHTSGSIVFPDRITFDAARGLYRFDFHSKLDREYCLTTFWVRRADLDRIGVVTAD